MNDARKKAAQELLRRRKARRCLHSFIEYLRPDFIASDFSRSVCGALDRFIEQVEAGKRPVLVLGAPPQHGKSEIVSRYLPAYLLGRSPGKRIGGLSYGKTLASSMNRDVQRIIMSEGYSRIFPETRLGGEYVQNASEFEVAGKGGSYVGEGVGGPLTGKSIDIGIIDDPIKNAQEARSKTTKDAVWSWYTSVFMTRLSKQSGQIIMATRWAVDDLSGRVIERFGRRVDVLTFPAISEAGEPLVPELHPLEKLEEYRRILSEGEWWALYQQSPRVGTGNIFKLENFQTYTTLPEGAAGWVRGWDFAATAKDTADYTASARMLMHEGDLYVSHVARWQVGPDDVMRLFQEISLAEKEDTRVIYPQDPAGAGKILAAIMAKSIDGVDQEYKRVSGDKVSYALPFARKFNAGNVYFHYTLGHDSFLTEELQNFPNGRNDDMVDALSWAYADLALPADEGGGSLLDMFL